MLSCLFSTIKLQLIVHDANPGMLTTAMHSSAYNLVIHCNKSFTTYLNVKASNDLQTKKEKHICWHSRKTSIRMWNWISSHSLCHSKGTNHFLLLWCIFSTRYMRVFFFYLNIGFELVPEIKISARSLFWSKDERKIIYVEALRMSDGIQVVNLHWVSRSDHKSCKIGLTVSTFFTWHWLRCEWNLGWWGLTLW